MHLNRTSVWKVMTILISRELLLFNFERLNMWCAWIGLPCEKLWPFDILKSFLCSILSLSTSYAPESNIHVKIYDHLNFSRVFVVQFRASRYIMPSNRTSVWKAMTTWILESFCCSISRVSIYYAPESDFHVISYDHLNFSTASVVQFQSSWYIMHLNRTTVWKVMTIWISREPPLFNTDLLDILSPGIGPPCDK